MRVISEKKLRDFWNDPKNENTEEPLRSWIQQVRKANWQTPADVKRTYNSVDRVGRKLVFNVAGHRCRIITVIDYEGHKVFIRAVLDHKEYDKENWKKDTFGDDWKKRETGRGGPGQRDRRPGKGRRRA